MMTSKKVAHALERLNAVLPLKQSQEACGPEIKQLHQQLLKSFVTRGHPLSKEEMSRQIDDVDNAIDVLTNSDMATFSDSGELIGVYPFSTTERDYLIQVNELTVYAMCALDALAIAPLFNAVTHITSHCIVTGESIGIEMRGKKISNVNEVRNIHMGIAWNSANTNLCCADSLCKEMVFLHDKKAAQKWLNDTSKDGELFSLLEAVRLASRFFVPLLH